ncbi:hypothetical protein SELMODRAFT_184106 [Selaginella moellendorffii]|uniref:Peroxisome biogenesis protein 22 n=1 Tax=Selaginella moellendorffii TaxID=88036 RepID=D8SZL8_SELML|nr:peroxisome biogenesis protein 22 [Selaginella moellendorffii]EFJ10107.1 hypothetical protein SELMODRAFT_184106 [Selaginella moellendorffii]|eukprot:XP_002988845.1 peroxisome biogenesis protein 22 [Selaginella moellendorffii]
MANEVLEELAQIFRAASKKMSALVSFLMHHKDASSIGAIAGFAIALVCTWRYMRSSNPVRRPKPTAKVEAPSSSSSDSTSGSSTAIESRGSQARQRGVAIQEAPLSKLTLAQSVKRQLKGGRKVTCQLLGVVLQENSTADLENHAVVRPAAADVLLELAQCCDLYLMSRVNDDASEEAILAALDQIGLFSKANFNRNKVLFCSSEAGRCSFVRQLEPDWHIDTSVDIVNQLARYIHHELLISPAPLGSMPSNVLETNTLESYFDCR